jgi:hypothetical protein
MRGFTAESTNAELAVRAQYECVVATLRGLDTLQGVENDIRAVLDHADASQSPSLLTDASVLLMYWGGAWSRHIATVSADELRERNLALRARVHQLLETTDEVTYPHRKAALLGVAAHLCLHPRWPEVERHPAGALPSPSETTQLYLAHAEAGEILDVDSDVPLDVAEGLEYLESLVDLLPRAPAFPVGSISEIFQMLAPALAGDPRYTKVRDGLDAAVAIIGGDNAVAEKCRARAMAFRHAGRPLEALRELHEAKINWWHGDTLRGSLLVMRLIGRIYAELRLPHAAKQYALAVATLAAASGEMALQDQIPEGLIEAMDHCHVAGAWGDALAFADIAVRAHSAFAEDAFNPEAHPSLERLDFHAMIVLLAAERFRPEVLPVLRESVGDTPYILRLLGAGLDTVRSAFTSSEETFVQQADRQIVGRPFTDIGPWRTLTFAALGTAWRVTCRNDRRTVLAAERFAAAAQILLVELAPGDPVFLTQEVHVELHAGTPLSSRGPVRFKPNNERVECSVVLTPFTDKADRKGMDLQLCTALVYLFAHLSARPEHEFMETVEMAFAGGLLHKLHTARPYDDLAGFLDDAHYDALAAANMQPLAGEHVPTPAEELRIPTHPGPGYGRDESLAHIRENYEYLPSLLTQTVPRALADVGTLAGLWRLRDEGWLDWHILLAIWNVAWNIRAKAAGLLHPNAPEQPQRELAGTPETADSEPIPLTALSPDSLRQAMQLTVLSIGTRRWRLLSGTQTPNMAAFQALISMRYGFRDDVPHLDLFDGLAEDGTLRSLLGGS